MKLNDQIYRFICWLGNGDFQAGMAIYRKTVSK